MEKVLFTRCGNDPAYFAVVLLLATSERKTWSFPGFDVQAALSLAESRDEKRNHFQDREPIL